MVDLTALHELAMDIADDADFKKKGDAASIQRSKSLFTKAYTIEAFVARCCTIEPSRSILCLSAASLAYEAGLPEKVLYWSTVGQTDSTPAYIVQQFRELTEE